MPSYDWPKNKPPVIYAQLAPTSRGYGKPGGLTPTLTELLPCPCCGFQTPWYDRCDHEYGRMFWSVRCPECGLRTPAIANPNYCIECWNRRPEPMVALKVVGPDGEELDAK